MKKLVANKKRKEAGGSLNSGYDFHFFSSFESLGLYENKFKTRKIVLGKKIIFNNFVKVCMGI